MPTRTWRQPPHLIDDPDKAILKELLARVQTRPVLGEVLLDGGITRRQVIACGRELLNAAMSDESLFDWVQVFGEMGCRLDAERDAREGLAMELLGERIGQGYWLSPNLIAPGLLHHKPAVETAMAMALGSRLRAIKQPEDGQACLETLRKLATLAGAETLSCSKNGALWQAGATLGWRPCPDRTTLDAARPALAFLVQHQWIRIPELVELLENRIRMDGDDEQNDELQQKRTLIDMWVNIEAQAMNETTAAVARQGATKPRRL